MFGARAVSNCHVLGVSGPRADSRGDYSVIITDN